jgi:hypothetical protein
MLLKNCRWIAELSNGKGFASADVLNEQGKIATGPAR